MRYIAAYNLATLGGNSQPTSEDVSKILKSAGIKIDAAAVEKLVAELSGKDIKAIVADGMKKMASIPSGAAAASSAPAAASAAPAAAESKKEAAKPAKEESDEEMGFGLFD